MSGPVVRKMEHGDAEKASKMTKEIILDCLKKGLVPKKIGEMNISIHSSKYFQDSLKRKTNIIFVAEENGRIVGIIEGSLGESGVAELDWIGVHPTHQNKGIGNALLKKIGEYFRGKSCHKITVYTTPETVPAIHLYYKHGFIQEVYLEKEWWNIDWIKLSKWFDMDRRRKRKAI